MRLQTEKKTIATTQEASSKRHNISGALSREEKL